MPDPIEPKEEWNVIWESRDPFWNNDWVVIWSGIYHFEAPWKFLEFGEFLKTLPVSLINFLLCNYDVYSDGMLVSSYMKGTYYEYNFLNASDPEILALNCTFKANHTNFYGDVPIYTHSCFSQEITLGVLTLMIMMLPGILLSILVVKGLNKEHKKLYMWVFIFCSPILWVTFPLVLFITKVIVKPH